MGQGGSGSRVSPVELGAAADFDLGDLRVRPARRQLCRRADGVCREAEPRVMQVLVALASARPEVVSRDRLVELCWNGRIVGDDAINRCILALRHLAREFDPPPFAIRTVPRVGYYLEEEPAAAGGGAAADAPAPPPAPSRFRAAPSRFRARRLAAAVAAGLLLALAGVGALVALGGDRSPAHAEAPATLAVLPFRALSPEEGWFADGLTEEVLGQIGRDPGLRVAGRASSAGIASAADARDLGRRLGVGHLLEGSVRRDRNRIRVTVALVATRDGMRVWTETYDGNLDDILAIQQRIGAATARTLHRTLVAGAAAAPRRHTSGAVYSLYLSARGLLRAREPNATKAAREKLRRAVALDPAFAPAWSSLAQAEHAHSQGRGAEPRLARERALAYVRRALALAPDLAEAHAVAGLLLGFDNPGGAAHVKRAALLDPENAEYQYWLGLVYGHEADFARMLAAHRRAFALDPLWPRAQEAAAVSAWEMGLRDEALARLRRIEAIGSRYQAHLVRAALLGLAGDFSGAAEELSRAERSTDEPLQKRWADTSRRLLFRNLRLPQPRPADAPDSRSVFGSIDADRLSLEVRAGKLPTRAQLKARNDNIPFFFEDRNYTAIAAKGLVNAGRAAEVVALYDSPGGLLGFSRGKRPAPGRLPVEGPLVAAALLAEGREAEAESIAAAVEAAASAALRRSGGRGPPWLLAGAAQAAALRGRRDVAIAALERAVASGWSYATAWDDSSLGDIGEEPAFRSLRGHPRFEAVRERLRRHLLRERTELARLR